MRPLLRAHSPQLRVLELSRSPVRGELKELEQLGELRVVRIAGAWNRIRGHVLSLEQLPHLEACSPSPYLIWRRALPHPTGSSLRCSHCPNLTHVPPSVASSLCVESGAGPLTAHPSLPNTD